MPVPITSTQPTDSSYREKKARGILGMLWLLVVLQYGVLCYFFLVVPVTTQIARGNSIDKALNGTAIGGFVLLCLMLLLGVKTMRFALKRVLNQPAMRQWVAGAAALSLSSICSYIMLFNQIELISVQLDLRGVSDSVYISLVVGLLIFGFYMPFIFLTCWVKYRYRADEF